MTASRFRFLVLFVVLAITLVVGVPGIRSFILRIPGWAITIPEPSIKSCDVVVLSLDVDGAGALEAADLVHRGVATRVAVFAEGPNAIEREFLHRGLPYRTATAELINELEELGVRDPEVIPMVVTGSEDEGKVLPEWCERNHFNSAVLVVNSDHSRRQQRILRRGIKGRSETVIIYPSRYTEFNPDAWWKTRADTRTVIEELQKLVLDFARHPIS